jgi:hypothetical protein
MINLHWNAAVLIDADNAQLSYLKQVLEISEYYGQVKISCAYGDWESARLFPWREKVDALGVARIQVKQVGKNATDHRMLLEAGEILGGNFYENDVRIFILVSGDGDFASACDYIRERGCQVIGTGNREQASESLRGACDKFYCLEDLNDELSKLREQHPIPPAKVREFFTPLIFAYARLTNKKYDWIPYTRIGNKLRELCPDYESKFGRYKLSLWLRQYSQEFETDGQMIRRIDSDPKAARYGSLIKAYIETKQPDGLASLDLLGKALRELDPNYDYRFGIKEVSEWLLDYPDAFEIRDNYVIHEYDKCLNQN